MIIVYVYWSIDWRFSSYRMSIREKIERKIQSLLRRCFDQRVIIDHWMWWWGEKSLSLLSKLMDIFCHFSFSLISKDKSEKWMSNCTLLLLLLLFSLLIHRITSTYVCLCASPIIFMLPYFVYIIKPFSYIHSFSFFFFMYSFIDFSSVESKTRRRRSLSSSPSCLVEKKKPNRIWMCIDIYMYMCTCVYVWPVSKVRRVVRRYGWTRRGRMARTTIWT